MKIAVWRTGHEIADRVAQSLAQGFSAQTYLASGDCSYAVNSNKAHIAYGILRGAADVFCECDKQRKPWFNVDRGYFNPSHFDGYYRISHRGTQARYDPAYPVKDCGIELQPIQKHQRSHILICPPTEAVAEFFNIHIEDWIEYARTEATKTKLLWAIRHKGEQWQIPWNNIHAVITFNSSVGWQALINGIPCLSDPLHSVVGSYYNTKSIDECIEMFNTRPRKPLLDFMRSHQFTLAEIAQGDAWPLINHYLSKSSSASTAASR